MRIISGTARGRKLEAPRGSRTRPTPDRVREAVFSILGERVPGAAVLDLYAGTGAMGLEALSRGAGEAVFVENDPAALRCLGRNIAACGWQDRATVLARAVPGFLRAGPGRSSFDLVFADPPYRGSLGTLTLMGLSKHAKSLKRCLIILEHAPGNRPGPVPDNMEVVDSRQYGSTAITFIAFKGPWEPH